MVGWLQRKPEVVGECRVPGRALRPGPASSATGTPGAAAETTCRCLSPTSESSVTHTEAQPGSPGLVPAFCQGRWWTLGVDLLLGCVALRGAKSPTTSRPEASYLVWGQWWPAGLIVIHRSELKSSELWGSRMVSMPQGTGRRPPFVCLSFSHPSASPV